MATSEGYVSRYDVFLSFQGDTRHGFTDHLYDNLDRAGVYTFRDNNNIRVGEDLKPEIKRAIRESRASIIVLSELYALSRWCLDELYLILQERKRRNHFVLPIFYHVNPSHVKKREGNFKIEAKVGTKWTEPKVKRWNKALKKIGKMAGKVPSGSEVEFSQQIVKMIKEKLNFVQVYRQPNLVGMDTRDKEINAWLENSDDGEILAIWGMDGGGKSTLAMHIVCSNWHKFESVSILDDIGSRSPEELRQLQEKLIRDITEGKEETFPSVCQGTYQIRKALKTNKAIVVLDNIVTKEQLDKFLGTATETGTENDTQIETKTKSKIIITTTEKNASTWFQSASWRCKEHEIKLLDDVDSLKLLKLHGFKPNAPMDGYEEYAKRALVCCQGNPLALKVWGSSLCCDSSYTSDRRKQYWESMMTSLERQVAFNIQEVLIKSYSSLQLEPVKELFLHIACFFNGKDKNYVEKILEPDYNAVSGIVTLTNKCLLSVSPDNKLMMHQLLQEMGRTVVLAESPRLPGDRSRVWRDNESHQVLSRYIGSTKVLGLALDMEMLRQQDEKGKKKLSDPVNTVSFEKMKSLKLLQLNELELEGSYMNIFKDLRWLCWRKFCLEAIPPELDMENLVAINMSCSKLEVFQLPVDMPLLKILNLTDSHNLCEIRDISLLFNLDTLILKNCRKLVCVFETLEDLTSLATLDITGCDKLCKREQPNSFERMKAKFVGGKKTEQSSFLLPDSVQRLLLKDCNLESADNFLHFRDQSHLKYLNLANNPFEILPNYTHLEQLLILDLTGCGKLKMLLYLPRNLAELYISNCESLERVTFELHKYTLQEFQYKSCVNLFEVEDFFKLVPVSKLEDTDLGNMKWLREYQEREVFLVGDGEVTKGRSLCLQMLYEFNIMSISLPDIEKPNRIPANQYTSEYPELFFEVPNCSRKIKGLNLTFKYTMQGNDDWVWFTKIRTNNGVDLIYNAKVFGRPASDEVGIWLSYWPIGNSLHDGDEVNVDIVVTKGLEIKGCGASLVYTDEEDESDSDEDSNESFVDANDFFEENNKFYEDNNKFYEDNNENSDILGVDISEFRLSTGIYYLCRNDYSHLMEIGRLSPSWFKNLVGDTIDYAEIGGWRKTGRPDQPYRSYSKLKTVGCIIYGPHLEGLYKIEELSKSSLSDNIEEYTSGFSKDATKADDEWIEHDEPGVYITLTSLPGGSKGLINNILGSKTISNEDTLNEANDADANLVKLPIVVTNSVSLPIVEKNHSKGVKSVYELEYIPIWGTHSVIGKRPEMEDAVAVVPHFMEVPIKMFVGDHVVDGVNSSLTNLTTHFFGVYDGHGGSQVANYCSEWVHVALEEELKVYVQETINDTLQVQWEKVFTKCFQKVDDEVGGRISKRTLEAQGDTFKVTTEPVAPETVGSTAVVAVINSSHIIVANCGDSRAVLYRGKAVVVLSNDHKPNREDELARIEDAGGKVIQCNGHRVFGVLAMSRSIGHGYLKPWIIPDPEVTYTARAREDDCLVLASDGLWDVMSNEEVCEVARKQILIWHKKNGGNVTDKGNGNGVDHAAQAAADYLVMRALQKGSKDNISVIVVDLKAVRKFKTKS